MHPSIEPDTPPFVGLALVPLDCLLIRDLVLSCDEVNGLMDGLDAATSTGGQE